VTRIRLSRIFWIGAAAILVAAALVALVAVLRGDFSDTDGRILITMGALLYTGGAALAGLALADRGPARRRVGDLVVRVRR
jgi:drug/metabolite transporter (DMT)-like permease